MDAERNMTLADEFAELNSRIPEYLAVQYPHLAVQAEALRSEFTVSVPGSIEDDETEKAMTDLGVRINSFLKTCGNEKKATKELPTQAPKLIDEFFNGLTNAVAANMETLRSRVNVYKSQKIEAERRRAEEERAKVLAAQRAAEQQRAEAERLRREAEEARIRECEAAAAADRPAEQTPEEVAAHAAEREYDQRFADSVQTTISAKAPTVAPMVKTESGAKSGQRGQWVAKDIDRDALDLEALRPLIPFADLEKYANAYARQYKDTKPLTGARIVQEFNTTFRG